MLFKIVRFLFIFCFLGLQISFAEQIDKTEKYKKKLEYNAQVYPYVFVGVFVDEENPEPVEDDYMPGGGYILKKIKVLKNLKPDVEMESVIQVKVPLDIFNIDKLDSKTIQKDWWNLVQESNQIDAKVNEGGKDAEQYIALKEKIDKKLPPLSFRNYLVKAVDRGGDYSLNQSVKYYFIFEKPEQGIYAITTIRHIMPIGSGFYVDVMQDELEAELKAKEVQ